MDMASVKISVKNKARIEALKEHPRETIDDVLDRALSRAELAQRLYPTAARTEAPA